jgi:hypothetical protein
MSVDARVTVRVNPDGMDATIGVDFLSRCFGAQWSTAMYRWYLQRSFNGNETDRLILTDGDEVLGGCGLAYRLLRTPDGVLHPVSVVTAACTAPEQRGRGHYARFLQAAREHSALRGYTALLGFVTANNATGRGLLRLGATAIPSVYIVSRRVPRLSRITPLRTCTATVTEGWPARAVSRSYAPDLVAGFHYPDARAWWSQMVDRPHAVQCLRVGATCRAIVERVGDTDRLQWLDGDERERVGAIGTIATRAQCAKRRFFMYSTRPGDTAATCRLGLMARPGFMMALAADVRHESTVRGWAALPWHVQSGDRL